MNRKVKVFVIKTFVFIVISNQNWTFSMADPAKKHKIHAAAFDDLFITYFYCGGREHGSLGHLSPGFATDFFACPL